MSYVQRIIDQVKAKDPDQPEFIQAVTEVMSTLEPVIEAHPEYEEAKILERIVEPERIIQFRVPWVDDKGEVQVNRGSASSTTPQSAPTRAACASTPQFIWAC